MDNRKIVLWGNRYSQHTESEYIWFNSGFYTTSHHTSIQFHSET